MPGTANFAPDPLVDIYRAVTQGRADHAAERARVHLNAIPRLFTADAPAFVVVKEAMVIAGLIPHAATRPPALPLTEEERSALRRGLEALGIGAVRPRASRVHGVSQSGQTGGAPR